MRHKDYTTYDYMMRLFEDIGFRPTVTQEISQLQIIISLVAAGFGISLVPKSVAKSALSDGVAYVDLVDPTPRVEFNIVWRHDNTSPILHTFIDTVREVAQEAARNV